MLMRTMLGVMCLTLAATIGCSDGSVPSPSPSPTPAAPASAGTESQEDPKIEAALNELSEEDRTLAKAQKFCAVAEKGRLGSMGKPVKIMIEGQPVFLCCDGCEEDALKNPQETLAKVEKLKEANK